MVEVVFEKVVFGEIGDVGLLDVRDVGGAEEADIHGGRFVGLVVVEGGGGMAGLTWGRLVN